MKASELRIGNLVYKNGIATEITADTMLDILRYTTPFEPIRLTEEWLLKFGFERNKDAWTSFIKNDVIIATDKFIYMSRTKLKYVHQLQNLYFALTGEELTFKSE